MSTWHYWNKYIHSSRVANRCPSASHRIYRRTKKPFLIQLGKLTQSQDTETHTKPRCCVISVLRYRYRYFVNRLRYRYFTFFFFGIGKFAVGLLPFKKYALAGQCVWKNVAKNWICQMKNNAKIVRTKREREKDSLNEINGRNRVWLCFFLCYCLHVWCEFSSLDDKYVIVLKPIGCQKISVVVELKKKTGEINRVKRTIHIIGVYTYLNGGFGREK